IDMGVDNGFVRKAGAWYTYEGDQLGQGKENARNFLKDNPDLANEIEKKILEKLGVGVRPDATPAEQPGTDASGTAAAPADGAAKPVTAAAGKAKPAKTAAAKS
ncbi:DNA recombination/repair protein RecA, partial [Streptomyces sp. NPDC058221]